MAWPNQNILALLGVEHPIIQAPMAGPVFGDMVVAVAEAGGLGSLPCATMGAAQIRQELTAIRQQISKPINVNFFCHRPPVADAGEEARWRAVLRPYYVEYGLDPDAPVPTSNRTPFDDEMCSLVEEFRPEIVSFHFGLPADDLLRRVKATGAKVLSSATTVREARWLEEHGCDAIIAQGFEAGGHRGNFLSDDISTQVGTFALVPQVVDAVSVPVIAAGGIADARGIVAAFALGAAAVQIGTAYLFTSQARLAPLHRAALHGASADETALTNIFTGRPARGIVNRVMRERGPMTKDAPAFPLAGGALAPLRTAAEGAGHDGFMSLWAGQSAALCQDMPAGALTGKLAAETLRILESAFSQQELNLMKLYYSPGSCAMAPHIVANEAEIPVELIRVDLASKKTEKGDDYFAVNPHGYVPTLTLDDGQTLTEASLLVQYLGDLKPETGLIPAAGTMERYRVQQALVFISTELHKSFSPFFKPGTPEDTKTANRALLGRRVEQVDRQLADRTFLTGETFTVADAYLFTILNWAKFANLDLSGFPNVQRFMAAVAARPAVQKTRQEQGLA